MNRVFFILGACLLVISSCNENQSKKEKHLKLILPDETQKKDTVVEQSVSVDIDKGEDWVEIGDALGDLDGDGIPEKVVVYNSFIKVDEGTKRFVFVFKKKEEKWEPWKKTTGSVLPNKEHISNKKPFQSIQIVNQSIMINHFGSEEGNNWTFSHTYQLIEKEFKLINLSSTGGGLCQQWIDVYYDLISGKLYFTNTKEKCDDKGKVLDRKKDSRVFTYKVDQLPYMNNLNVTKNKLYVKEVPLTVYY